MEVQNKSNTSADTILEIKIKKIEEEVQEIKKTKSISWLTIIFSGLVATILATALNIIYQEYGINRTDYQIDTSNYIRIYNKIHGALITTSIKINNIGTAQLRIDKVDAVIQLKSHECHVLNTSWNTNIEPKKVLSSDISFNEKMTDENKQKRDQFGIEAINYLLSQYINIDKSIMDVRMFLSQEFIGDAKNFLQENTKWMEFNDNYKIMLVFSVNKNNKHEEINPNDIKLYKFKLVSYQIKILKELSLDNYKIPYKTLAEILVANNMVNYSVSSELIESKDEKEKMDFYNDCKGAI